MVTWRELLTHQKPTISAYTAIDETLAQDQIDDIEEEEKAYLRKIYNAFYIQMEACCTVPLVIK